MAAEARLDRLRYRPQLDGLRCICVIFTLFSHIPAAPWWINGNIGVDTFFALSGFLITSLLMSELARSGSVKLSSFYIRRFFRIAPLYYLAIITSCAGAVLLLALGDSAKIKPMLLALPYILSLNGEFKPADFGTFFGHSWTIGIEEKFYVVWPVVLLLFHRRMMALAAVAALFGFVLWWSTGDETIVSGYTGLGFGCFFALYPLGRSSSRGAGAYPLLLFAAWYVFCIFFGHKYEHVGFSLISGLLVAQLYDADDSRIGKTLGSPMLAYLGKLTYGIYLFHILCINLVQLVFRKLALPQQWLLVFLASYGLSVLVAHVLYRLFEKPLIDVGRRLAERRRAAELPAPGSG